MSITKEELRSIVIDENDRKNLTPEQLTALEEMLRELREEEIKTVRLTNADKFDAKDMVPAGQIEPVKWKLKDPTKK